MYIGIIGDIRNKKARAAAQSHIKTGIVLEDSTLSEYEFRVVDGRLSLGSAAFAMLRDYSQHTDRN